MQSMICNRFVRFGLSFAPNLVSILFNSKGDLLIFVGDFLCSDGGFRSHMFFFLNRGIQIQQHNLTFIRFISNWNVFFFLITSWQGIKHIFHSQYERDMQIIIIINYNIKMSTINLNDQILKYEVKQKQFLNERKLVLRQLTSIRKSQRYFKNQNEYPSYIDTNNEGEDRIRKLRKLNSDTHNNTTPSKLEGNILSEQHLPLSDSKKQIHSENKIDQNQQKQLKVPEKIQERNKRIFGNLTKHLATAKNDLHVQQEKIRKKQDIEQKVKQKLVKQTKNMNEQKKASLAKKRQMQTKKKDEISKELLKIENFLLQTKYVQYLQNFAAFIPTKTQPTIYWKPAKENDHLKKQLVQSVSLLKQKEETVVKLIKSITQPIQYSKLMVQNQNEYLTNKIDKYFKSQTGNIITQSLPNIFWRPAKWNQSLKQLQQKSNTQIQQNRQKIQIVKSKHKQQSQEQIESDSEAAEQHSQKQSESK